jgi:CheY-like chemotaxis protein
MVEDDREVLTLTKESLEFLGYHVIAAKNGAAALTALKAHDVVSLLLTDIQLGDPNGPELAELARAARPDLPVLYATGYAAMAVQHRGLLDRDAKTISKPFTLAQLATAIRDAIDHPAAQKAARLRR